MLARFGVDLPAAGFAFYLEQAMAATAAQDAIESAGSSPSANKKLRIAVPKGSLNEGSIAVLKAAGLDVSGLDNPGRQLIISTESADYIIVRPTDAPAFVAAGAADAGICGRDSLLESGVDVVELVDLKFGDCRFVVAEPAGAHAAVQERYAKLGSIRVATKYPNITLAHFAKTGMEVDILKLHGNIELAPLTGLAEAIVDITATGTTLRENNLVVVDEVLGSTARFFANPCALRTNPQIMELARTLAANAITD
jgi:ATP phosphoribosyltransferase regulatory subunit